MRNGNGQGSGRRWLLIGLLILGGYWLANDSYRNGYTDALVQTGQAANVRYYRGGPHFPWGLLILGGIGYVAWRKGAFDRFGGPGGPFGNSGRGMQPYGEGYDARFGPGQPPAQGQWVNPMFRGPRAFFDEWHRQSHQAHGMHGHQPAPPAPPAGQPAAENGHGTPQATATQTAPPPPPTADYWATMGSGAGAPGTQGAPGGQAAATPEARTDEQASGPREAGGPALERW